MKATTTNTLLRELSVRDSLRDPLYTETLSKMPRKVIFTVKPT